MSKRYYALHQEGDIFPTFFDSMQGDMELDAEIVEELLNMYYESSKKDSELIIRLRKRIHELHREVEKLETFKKILEYVEIDMAERADRQAYCEKEFGGL